jgi:death on curing protein
MTVYLTAQQILFIHARLIDTMGGEHGLLNLGLLEAAAARPQATLEGAELYESLFQKAAALMESLLQNHPFLDGNKRTAITATALFLVQNGRRLQVTNEGLERAVLWVVSDRPSLDALAAWLKEQSVESG